ncbi:hypothetical protein A2U01_0064243, partial [Trifolium medium]|nr:hypothetical protein [Trifolium medium]
MRRPVAEQLAIAVAPAGIMEGLSGAGHGRSSRGIARFCVFMEHKALFMAEIAGLAQLLGLPLSPSQ